MAESARNAGKDEFALDFAIAPYTYVEIVSKPAGFVYAEMI